MSVIVVPLWRSTCTCRQPIVESCCIRVHNARVGHSFYTLAFAATGACMTSVPATGAWTAQPDHITYVSLFNSGVPRTPSRLPPAGSVTRTTKPKKNVCCVLVSSSLVLTANLFLFPTQLSSHFLWTTFVEAGHGPWELLQAYTKLHTGSRNCR